MNYQYTMACRTSPIKLSYPGSCGLVCVEETPVPGTVRRAREILQDSANCSVCASYSFSLPKEPMLSHEIRLRLVRRAVICRDSI